eukprot:17221-Heterococcus_DN1.PRE.2
MKSVYSCCNDALRSLKGWWHKCSSESRADWVDEARIIDHTAVKPEGYDDIPEHLPDPDAVKPDVWDEYCTALPVVRAVAGTAISHYTTNDDCAGY